MKLTNRRYEAIIIIIYYCYYENRTQSTTYDNLETELNY
jgi:hypothetical protein